MQRRKQLRVLLDHPYFKSRPKNVLPRKEATRIFNSGFPSFSEMIDGAKTRFDVPLSEWTAFDEVIEARASKNVFTNGFVYRHRRFAVAFVIFLMVISFFTMTPVGRALAADFFDMIMKVIDGRIEISSEHPDYEKYEYFNVIAEQYNEEDNKDVEENIPVFYPSLEEFVLQTGYKPVTINTDWLKCQTIRSYENEVQGLTLRILYYTQDGSLVVVTQQWGGADMVIEVQNANYKKAMILDNTEMLYTIDPADGSFNGTAVLSDSVLLIGAEKGVDTDKLLETLK